MSRKHYDLKARVIKNKYNSILHGFEETRDDRRVAWNCYQQLLTACDAMKDFDTNNAFICSSVNASINQQEAEIDRIITRFTGLEWRDNEWIKPLYTGLYFEVYRESTQDGIEDTLVKRTSNGEDAFRMARNTEEVSGIGHYILIVTPSGQKIKSNDF